MLIDLAADMFLMPAERAVINGISIFAEHEHLDELGSPVVMIHGWTADRYRNGPVFDHLRQLGLPVLRYDLRGHGWSQKGLTGTYTMATCVDDLQGIIETVVKRVHGERKVILYGHSMGGTVAMLHALRFPKIVGRLILVAPWLKATASEDIIAGFNALLAGYARKFEREFGRKKAEQAKLGLEFFPHWSDATLLPEQQATVELGKDMMEYEENIDALTTITIPTHVFIGTTDRPDVQAAARLVHEKIPGSTLDAVAGGHNLAIEAHETFPAMVAKYARRDNLS